MSKKLVSSLLVLVIALGLVISSLAAIPAQQASGASAPRVRDFLGINTGDRTSNVSEVAQVAGWVRDYMRWYWYEPTNDNYTFPSTDYWYRALKQAGLGVLVTVDFAPGWSTNTGTTTGLPYYTGDGTKPADYAEHSDYLAQITARWGRQKYPANDSRIRTRDKVTGLGYLDYIESFNEPDYWWRQPTFPGSKYAKMLEIDYNGYGDTPNAARPILGVKNADPTIGFTHGGVLGAHTSYLDDVLRALDPGQKPFDAVNFHYFCIGQPGKGGVAPEASSLVWGINTMKRWRDTKAPGKPLWLTEMGWDTYTDGVFPSKVWAPELSAANYLLRVMALGMANGLDKMFMYIYKDPELNSITNYFSMGLVTYANGHDGNKKAGWYYLATAKSLLGDYVFEKVDKNGDGTPALYSYIFSKPETGEKVVMLWVRNIGSSIDNGAIRRNYFLKLPGAEIATLVEPVKGLAQGQQTPLTISNPATGSANVTIPLLSEKPVFVYYKPNSIWLTPTVAPSPTPTGPVMPLPNVNLLYNPGMETDDNADGEPDGWVVPSYKTNVVSLTTDQVKSGARSLRHSSSGGDSYTVYQDVPAMPGLTYNFRGWVNIPSLAASSKFGFQVQFLNQWNGLIYSPTPQMGKTYSGPTNQWEQVTASVTVPDGARKVRILMNVSALNGTIYVDDLEFLWPDSSVPTPTPTSSTVGPTPTATPTPTPTATPSPTPTATPTPTPTATAVPTELLTNGGFEADGNNDGFPAGWSVTPTPSSAVSLDGSIAYEGSYSLKLSSSRGETAWVFQDMQTGAGSYRLSGQFYLIAGSVPPSLAFQLTSFNRWGGKISTQTIAVPTGGPTGTWTPFDSPIAIPANTEKVRVQLGATYLKGTALADRLSFARQ